MPCFHRTKKVFLFLTLTALCLTFLPLSTGPGMRAEARVLPECSDGIDNDRDGRFDYPYDSDCGSEMDDTEGPQTDGFFVAISDGEETISQEEHLLYTVSIQSDSSEMITTNVSFLIPDYTDFVTANSTFTKQGNLIVWRDTVIFPGSTRTLTAEVVVQKDTRDDTLIVAEASAKGLTALETTRVLRRDDTVPAPLALSIDDGKVFAQPDEILRYRITADNADCPDRTFTMRLKLPPNLTFLGASGQYRMDGETIEWADQPIRASDVREYTVDAAVERDTPEFTVLNAKVSAGPAIASDATSVLFKTVPPSTLAVNVDDGQSAVKPGQELTYAIVIRNNHSMLATNVEATDALPLYTEFVSATEGGVWTGKDIHWTGLTISPNGERSLSVTLRVRSDAPLGETLRNSVTALGQTGIDQTEVSDSALAEGALRAPVSAVLLRKLADRTEVRPGDTVGYAIYLQNTLKNTITNVVIEDRMDSPYLEVLGAEQGQMLNGQLVWRVPELGPGQTWTIRYSARIRSDAPHGVTVPNVVTVSGNGMESVSLTERVTTTRISVVGSLPKTGVATDAIVALLLSALAAVPTLVVSRRRLLLPA
ncbi:MAG: hypothetical protein V1926_04675 [Candidatus Peregrinibacteria bacterium]